MERKKLIYIIGGIAVIGIGYYLYKNKQKTPLEDGGEGTISSDAPSTQPPTQQPSKEGETTTGATANASKKEARKQSKTDEANYPMCGKKPAFKKQRAIWQSCIDEQKKKASATTSATTSPTGSSPFEGASTSFDIYSRMTGELTDNMDIF